MVVCERLKLETILYAAIWLVASALRALLEDAQ
jgi:hypothetical protein